MKIIGSLEHWPSSHPRVLVTFQDAEIFALVWEVLEGLNQQPFVECHLDSLEWVSVSLVGESDTAYIWTALYRLHTIFTLCQWVLTTALGGNRNPERGGDLPSTGQPEEGLRLIPWRPPGLGPFNPYHTTHRSSYIVRRHWLELLKNSIFYERLLEVLAFDIGLKMGMTFFLFTILIGHGRRFGKYNKVQKTK